MFTHFDKAWFAPALASWLDAGLEGLVSHAFNITIPDNIHTYILLGLTSAIVYVIPNKTAAPAAPAAPAA
jgi:hypothetical protein